MDETLLKELKENGRYLAKIGDELYKSIGIGKKLNEIADEFDNKIKKDGYRAMPICIGSGGCVYNHVPLKVQTITEDDVINYRIELIPRKGPHLIYGSTWTSGFGPILLQVSEIMQKIISISKNGTTMKQLCKEYQDGLDNFEFHSQFGLQSVANVLSEKVYPRSKSKEEAKVFAPRSDFRKKQLLEFINNKSMKTGEVYVIDIIGTSASRPEVTVPMQNYPTLMSISTDSKKKIIERLRRITGTGQSMRLYGIMSKHFGAGEWFATRKLAKIFKEETKTDIDLPNLEPLCSTGIVKTRPLLFVEENFVEKTNRISMLNSEINSGDCPNKKELEDEMREIQKNTTIIFRVTHTIYITDDGCIILDNKLDNDNIISKV
jgi:methionine aminopeptidase